MRRDVRINRERILDAAQELIDEHGLAVPMLRVIERSGLGTATVYRHFPTMDDLARGLYERYVAHVIELGERLTTQMSGWEAVHAYVDDATRGLIDHPGSADVMRRVHELDPDDDPAGVTRADMRLVVERAQAEGRLRPDITPPDVAALPYAIAAWVRLYPPERREVGRARVTTLLLSALTPDYGEPVDDGAMSADEFRDGAHRRRTDRT